MDPRTTARRDRRRIADLYRSHGSMVLRRARQITGNSEEAEEVLHELFRRLIEQPHALDQARDQRAWLYGATTHLCLNRIRNRKNRQRLLRERRPVDRHTTARPEDIAAARELIAQLPDELSAAVVYFYLDQMTYDEIAKLLGCSRRHVGNLLQRARNMINTLTE